MFSEPDESEFMLQVWYIGYLPEDWIGGFKDFFEVMDELDGFDQEESFTFKVRREWEDDYIELDFSPDRIPYKMSFHGTQEEHGLINAINNVDVDYLTK